MELQGKGWHIFKPLQQEGSLVLENNVFPISPHGLFLFRASSQPERTTTKPLSYLLLPIETQLLVQYSTAQTNFIPLIHHPFRYTLLTEEERIPVEKQLEALTTFEKNDTFGNDIAYQMELLRLLVMIVPLFCREEEPEGSQTHERVVPILEYIGENLSEPLCLEQIATHFYVSKPYLCRMFKAVTGSTVMEYIISCRIEKACQLLMQGYSVQRAGELSGFYDNSHFIRTFGRMVGCSPGKYAKGFTAQIEGVSNT